MFQTIIKGKKDQSTRNASRKLQILTEDRLGIFRASQHDQMGWTIVRAESTIEEIMEC